MDKIKTIEDRKKGFSTLNNKYNTCYLNCVIQSLSNNYMLRNYLKMVSNSDQELDCIDRSNSYETPDFESNKILDNFTKLITCMWRKTLKITPTSFYTTFLEKFPQYIKGYQHDARDFLFDLIGELHMSLEQKTVAMQSSEYSSKHYLGAMLEWRNYFENKKSWISDNFFGQYLKKFTCKNCGHIFYKYDVFLSIIVECKNKSIKDLVGNSMAIDFLNMECQECKEVFDDSVDLDDIPDFVKNREHSIETSTYKLPETLIVLVSCFTSNSQKILESVQIEETLDLYQSHITNSDESTVYTLSSIVYHQGSSLSKGHYFTVVKRKTAYYLFNDSDVEEINLSVLEENKNCTPYIFFYEKNGIPERI